MNRLEKEELTLLVRKLIAKRNNACLDFTTKCHKNNFSEELLKLIEKENYEIHKFNLIDPKKSLKIDVFKYVREIDVDKPKLAKLLAALIVTVMDDIQDQEKCLYDDEIDFLATAIQYLAITYPASTLKTLIEIFLKEDEEKLEEIFAQYTLSEIYPSKTYMYAAIKARLKNLSKEKDYLEILSNNELDLNMLRTKDRQFIAVFSNLESYDLPIKVPEEVTKELIINFVRCILFNFFKFFF